MRFTSRGAGKIRGLQGGSKEAPRGVGRAKILPTPLFVDSLLTLPIVGKAIISINI